MALDIDWRGLLAVYRAAIEDGARPDRVIRRYFAHCGQALDATRLAEIQAELERRIETEPDEPPPEPAPLYPPPPPEPPQAEAVTTPLPELAPSARQEPPMSASPDLGAALLRALPAALSLYRVAADTGAIEEVADAIASVARKGARRARRGPITDEARDELRREACDELQCVLGDLPADALEALGEIAIDAIDEHTNTGPLDEVDGVIVRRGLSALLERIREWSEPDPGNLEALAKRARRTAARAEREAERLERIAARKRNRG